MIRLLHDRILIKRSEEGQTDGGELILYGTAKKKPQEGIVIAVGAGQSSENGRSVSHEVKAGEKVLFDRHSGSAIKIDDVEYVILRGEDVLGVIGSTNRDRRVQARLLFARGQGRSADGDAAVLVSRPTSRRMTDSEVEG